MKKNRNWNILMNKAELKLFREVLSGCGEQLEHVHEKDKDAVLIPLLLRMVVQERELTNYYRKRCNKRVDNGINN